MTDSSNEQVPRLSYTESGQGDPIVLLHGIPGSARTWNEVVPLLSKARVIVPDLLGFGQSPAGSARVHAVEQAAAVLAMLDDAGVDAAHVVGFDFGGPVAVAMHQLAPHRVTRLTLAATNLMADTPVPLPLRVAVVPRIGELAFRFLFSGSGLAALWRLATVNRRAFSLSTFRGVTDPRGNATASRIFLQSLRAMQKLYGPIEAEIAKIEVPVTIVWGDRDPFFPIAVGQRTAKRFRDARWILLRGCGHFLPHEQPAEMAAAILGRT